MVPGNRRSDVAAGTLGAAGVVRLLRAARRRIERRDPDVSTAAMRGRRGAGRVRRTLGVEPVSRATGDRLVRGRSGGTVSAPRLHVYSRASRHLGRVGRRRVVRLGLGPRTRRLAATCRSSRSRRRLAAVDRSDSGPADRRRDARTVSFGTANLRRLADVRPSPFAPRGALRRPGKATIRRAGAPTKFPSPRPRRWPPPTTVRPPTATARCGKPDTKRCTSTTCC